MSLSRRSTLKALAAIGLSGAGTVAWMSSTSADERTRILVSAAQHKRDGDGLGWWDSSTATSRHVLSGFRGHSIIAHPLRAGHAVMMGRRPSMESVEVDLRNSKIVARVQSQAERHFFGHAVFSPDGAKLFTTENNLASGRGMVVVRDADNYQVLDEFESHGIGPHEIRMMPDGRTLIVANGGILTRPESGREKLNLDSMDSSLVLIDTQDGSLTEQHRIPYPKASMRHLAVARDGRVAIGFQLQRAAMDNDSVAPLAGVLTPGRSIRVFHEPVNVLREMRDYVGSVAVNNDAGVAAFTSPRGNLAAFWNIDTGSFSGYHTLFDVSGVTVTDDQQFFVLSNSNGHIRYIDANTLKEDKSRRLHAADVRWDNHLSYI
ncbi:MAG: DUF1513 domain-containing protein [Pseudomonadota bacterium]